MPSKTIIQLRRDTAANWTTTNPTLAAGETGYETDTGKIKIGNGTTAWATLSYNNVVPSDTGWISTASMGVPIAISTGWSLTSFNIRRLNGIVNGIITVSRTGAAITVPSTGNITNQNIATLSSGWYNTTSDSGMVLTNGAGPLTGGYIQSNGIITISAMTSGATISTGDNFSFTLFEMV